MLVVVNNGVNKLVDYLVSNLSYGVVGTGTTSESVTDSSLESPVSGTDNSLSNDDKGDYLVVDYPLPSTEANGEDITEFGLFFSDGSLFNRFTFGVLTKDQTEEWQFSVVVEVYNG